MMELTEGDFLSYKAQVMQSIKTETMAILSNEVTLKWIEEKLKKFKKKNLK